MTLFCSITKSWEVAEMETYSVIILETSLRSFFHGSCLTTLGVFIIFLTVFFVTRLDILSVNLRVFLLIVWYSCIDLCKQLVLCWNDWSNLASEGWIVFVMKGLAVGKLDEIVC